VILEIVSKVLPFFLLVGLGVLLVRRRLLDAAMVQGLSAYVFWLGFPALLVHSLARVGRPGPELTAGLAAFAGAALAVMALVWLGGRLAGWSPAERAGAAMSASLGNSAFLGLPLATAVLGAEAGRLAAGVVAVDFVIVAAAGVTLLGAAAGRPPLRALLAALANPVVAAAALGSGLALSGVVLPGLIDRTLGMAAASGSPVALVALGAALALPGDRSEPVRAGPVLLTSLVKLLALPALTWLAVGAVGAPADFRAGATLLAATPTAVNVFIQTRASGVFARGAARIVALTTAAAVLTLTLLAAALTMG